MIIISNSNFNRNEIKRFKKFKPFDTHFNNILQSQLIPQLRIIWGDFFRVFHMDRYGRKSDRCNMKSKFN